MADCTEKWVTAFVTRPDTAVGRSYEFDDEFMCTVQSVQIATAGTTTSAMLIADKSPYIIPAWSVAYDTPGGTLGGGFGTHPLRLVKAGDIVRIGNASTGTTDYLTVIEVLHVDEIVGAISAGKAGSTGDTSGSDNNRDDDGVPLAPKDWYTSDGSGDDVPRLKNQSHSFNTTAGTTAGHVTATGHGHAFEVGSTQTDIDYDVQQGTTTKAGTRYQFSKGGIGHIVLRLNAEIDVTSVNSSFWGDSVDKRDGALPDPASDSQARGGGGMQKMFKFAHVALGNRHKCKFHITTPSQHSFHFAGRTPGATVEDIDDERFCYPLYWARQWADNVPRVSVKLDHGIKAIKCIKLVGYSIVNKSQGGLSHQHEQKNDDYLLLNIDEVSGQVLSNNSRAHGAFAVLQTTTDNNVSGAVEQSRFDPQGLFTHTFDEWASGVRSLTINVTDRMGEPAHIGRLHLWFKLMVRHG